MIDLKFDVVSKRYLIQSESEDADRQHPIMRKLRAFWQKPTEFWAVRDVSFEVRRGEALGIIGHNGAGKSTILKLLAGITTPSQGEITIRGNIAALIEVGSGFHPELTGRENVYLSGSILGMRRSEIRRKLDSIIDFAEIREFIDTPVKRYSSGMYVRLGFSIAAHLDPDILLLDEVLAVGDAAFQTKCLERVHELQASGKTIIFISHDLNAVERMCDRVLLMQHGELIADGPPGDVIDKYKTSASKGLATPFKGVSAIREWPEDARPGNAMVRLRRVRVCNKSGGTTAQVNVIDPVGIEITYDVLEPGHILVPNVHFFNETRICLFAVVDVDPEWRGRPKPAGRYVSTAWIPGNLLSEGNLLLDVDISTHVPIAGVHVHARGVVTFGVMDSFSPDSARGDYTGPMPGVVRPLVNWTTRAESLQRDGRSTVDAMKGVPLG
jgi:lipopolysaccharide transport system ATP-binding protein